MGPAILYAAKSTADEHGSIPTQLDDARALAEREGAEVVATYADEAASAWHGNRGPELEAAMNHCAELAPSWLVVQHTDRLARGDGVRSRHLIELYLWALKAGVSIRSVQDDSTCENLILAAVMGERNAEDSRRKSLAVKSGMKRRAARGLYTGRRPYGYRIVRRQDDDVRGLVIVEHEAEVVRRIFAEFLAGRSFVTIARALHRDGIPTASGRATWRSSTVSGLVRNPIYAGVLRYDGELHEGQHEAIIDAETWHRAVALLAARGPSKGRGRPPKGHHLFRGGMLRCGSCGDAMSPRTDSRGYEYYCCSGHIQLGDEYCEQGCVRRVVVDTAVYSYFEQVGLDVEATRRQVEQARDRQLAQARALREEAERELARTQESRERVERDYLSGALSAASHERFAERVRGEIAAARAALERLREHEAEAASWAQVQDVETRTLQHLAEIRRAIAGEVRDAEGVGAVRAALARAFECFVIHRDVQSTHAELAWVGDYMIEPVVREHAVEGYSEGMRPVLRREPLQQAENNCGVGSGCLKWQRRSASEAHGAGNAR